MASGRPFIAALTAFVASCALVAAADAANLQEGLSAYRDNRIAEGERILTEVAADPAASEADRAEARRELGRIDWLVRGETDGIADALARAPADRDGCRTAALAARVFRDAGQNFDLAGAAARLTQCEGVVADRLRIDLARSYMANAARAPDQRAAALAEAARLLGEVTMPRTASEIGAVRFSLALIQRDSASAFVAWREYFWLSETDAPQALNGYVGRVQTLFNAGLAPNAAPADVVALLTMVARAGFIADVRHIAEEERLAERAADDATWRRIAALLRFDASVRATVLAGNRRMVSGGRAGSFERDVQSAMQTLMREAGLSGEPRQALFEAFGLFGALGETSGYASLHGGYVVQDERVQVEQYRRSGDLRFVVLDNMISNGFESWLWDGWAQAGGWAPDNSTIVQVRPAYTRGPMEALTIARPGAAREARLADIARATAGETPTLAGGAVAALPGRSDVLEMQAIDAIAARVGTDNSTFIAEYWRLSVQHSIFIHEGRHVLDKASYRGGRSLRSEELEYRAKLSELALAEYPRMPLSNIVTQGPRDTPHGNANGRIMTAYRDWMNANTAAIAGYDASLPALAQLEKLSDDQIRAVARSLDPDAR